MRYRFANPTDMESFREMLEPGFKPNPEVQGRLLDLWKTLMAEGAIRITVIEEPGLPQPLAIQAVGASVFIKDDFAEDFARAPRPGLAAEIYHRVLSGGSPILSQAEVREANSGRGLHLVMLHFALRNPDLSDLKVQQLMMAVNASFVFFYSGFRMRTIMQEVYNRQAADYMRAGGFRLVQDFPAVAAGGNGAAHPDADAYLLRMSATDTLPAVVNPISLLFSPVQPRIYFSSSEQRVVERALLNQTDAEISQDLGISLDTVKKTWRRVYDRAAKTVPFLADKEGLETQGARGSEKRRYLLEYVRLHLEELHPYDRPKA